MLELVFLASARHFRSSDHASFSSGPNAIDSEILVFSSLGALLAPWSLFILLYMEELPQDARTGIFRSALNFWSQIPYQGSNEVDSEILVLWSLWAFLQPKSIFIFLYMGEWPRMLEVVILASARHFWSRIPYLWSKWGRFRDFSFLEPRCVFGALEPFPIFIYGRMAPCC